MRVAILTRNYPPDSMWGGDAVVYHNLARELSRRGHEIHVICQAVGRIYMSQEEGVFVHRVGTDSRQYSVSARLNYSLHAWKELLTLVRTRRVQLVEAPDWSAEGFLYCLRKKTPLVITAMGSTDDPVNASATFRQLAVQKILAYLATFTVGRSDKVIAVSIDSYQAVLRRYGVGALKVMKVPLGMDTQKFRYTPSDIRNRFGIEAGAEVVLHVGRLEARNGSIFLFKAIPQVVKRHPHVKFVLVGKSTKTAPGGLSFKDYILEQAAADGFYNNLLFVDFLPDDELVRMYSACDVCVYPAVTSTYGLPAVEAMACGKPVVATSVGIVGELADESSSGLTAVQTKDSGGLAEAILRYLDLHQEERERVGVANRRLIESRLSISSWVDLVLGVYEGLLKENQALPRPKG